MTIDGVKYNAGKPRTSLMSSSALLGMSKVLTYGERKYSAHNWRNGLRWSELVDAAMRHLLAFNDGEDLDPESGLPHIDHAACCLHFLSESQKKGLGLDDRYNDEKERREETETKTQEPAEGGERQDVTQAFRASSPQIVFNAGSAAPPQAKAPGPRSANGEGE